MGLAERLIIGAILIFSAYEIYEVACQRHHFHLLVAWITSVFRTNMGQYECLELLRRLLSAFFFTCGLSLIVYSSYDLAIIGQAFLIAFSLFDKTHGAWLNSYYWIAMNIAVLIIMVINREGIKAEQTMFASQEACIKRLIQKQYISYVQLSNRINSSAHTIKVSQKKEKLVDNLQNEQ